MTNNQDEKPSFFSSIAPGVLNYIFFCIFMAAAMVYANHIGWFPTYGIFSGENSMHSSHHGGTGYYGIHGK